MLTTATLETKFQRKLTAYWEKQGWTVLRLLRTNKGGLPDLLLLHPQRQPWFVEVKTGSDVSPVQAFRHAELRQSGFQVAVITPRDWPPTLERRSD